MLRTILFVAVALVGLTFGAAWAYAQFTSVDVTPLASAQAVAGNTCCAPGAVCCVPGSPCCSDGDCCTQGLECCDVGSPCCTVPVTAKADCCK